MAAVEQNYWLVYCSHTFVAWNPFHFASHTTHIHVPVHHRTHQPAWIPNSIWYGWKGFTGSSEIDWTRELCCALLVEEKPQFSNLWKNLFALALCSMRVTLKCCICCRFFDSLQLLQLLFRLFPLLLFTLYCHIVVVAPTILLRGVETLENALQRENDGGKILFFLFTYAHSTVETVAEVERCSHIRMKWSENSHLLLRARGESPREHINIFTVSRHVLKCGFLFPRLLLSIKMKLFSGLFGGIAEARLDFPSEFGVDLSMHRSGFIHKFGWMMNTVEDVWTYSVDHFYCHLRHTAIIGYRWEWMSDQEWNGDKQRVRVKWRTRACQRDCETERKSWKNIWEKNHFSFII